MQCAEAACAPTGLRTLAPFGGSLGTGHFLEGNGGEKKAGSEHRRLCLCVGAVRCGLSWATPEGSPVSHSGSVKKPDRRLMHYLQLDPSRSNLPKDSTGRIKGGPGRKKGAPNVLSRLSRTASLEFSRSSGASRDVRLGQEGPQERICLLRSHIGPSCSGPRRWTRRPRGWLRGLRSPALSRSEGRLPRQGLLCLAGCTLVSWKEI